MGRVNARAKAEVLRVLEEDPDAAMPTKGLFALPFMKKALDRQKEEARQRAEDFLEELEREEKEGGEGGGEGGGGGSDREGTGSEGSDGGGHAVAEGVMAFGPASATRASAAKKRPKRPSLPSLPSLPSPPPPASFPPQARQAGAVTTSEGPFTKPAGGGTSERDEERKEGKGGKEGKEG